MENLQREKEKIETIDIDLKGLWFVNARADRNFVWVPTLAQRYNPPQKEVSNGAICPSAVCIFPRNELIIKNIP